MGNKCEYSLQIQAKTFVAFAAIFNFIQIHDPDEDNFDSEEDLKENDDAEIPNIPGSDPLARVYRRAVTAAEKEYEELRQEAIVKAM